MSASPQGHCLLVDGSPAEAQLLSQLAGLTTISAGELADRISGTAETVDLVVVGSLVRSAVTVAQRAHRAAPEAAVAVLTSDAAAVRRQISFAPGVPLDVLVTGSDEPRLLQELDALRRTRVDRRRHVAVLAAVARQTAATRSEEVPGLTFVGALLEHAPIAAFLTTESGELLGWNRRAEDLLDLDAAAAGRTIDDVLPGTLPSVTTAADPTRPLGAQDTPAQVTVAGRMLELTAVASQTEDGVPVILLFASDVTAHRAAEHDRDRLAGQVQVLARVSEALTGRLDVAQPMSSVAAALVPGFADWASVQVREDGQLRNVAMRHCDPALEPVVRAAERIKESQRRFTAPSQLAAGGTVVHLRTVHPEDLPELVPDPSLRSLIERLGISSIVAVPVPGRTGGQGSLLLARVPGSSPFDTAELAVTVEIGRRVGVALDNARLFASQRDLATELQQSLLTAPPTIAFADIAVRYVAAGREAQVGGDWYDAFRRGPEELVVAIGDVVGHDVHAAAGMGQLRGLLRGIAFGPTECPDAVLTAVDEAIDGLELATMASAILARLFPIAEEGRSGVELCWSNAGHPAPVVLEADGHARFLEPVGKADLLLGVDAATVRVTQQAFLPTGSTLLLYTDGLVERRSETLDDGMGRLLQAVEKHADKSLEGLCDAILTGMVPEQAADDDIAIVAVRPRLPADVAIHGTPTCSGAMARPD